MLIVVYCCLFICSCPYCYIVSFHDVSIATPLPIVTWFNDVYSHQLSCCLPWHLLIWLVKMSVPLKTVARFDVYWSCSLCLMLYVKLSPQCCTALSSSFQLNQLTFWSVLLALTKNPIIISPTGTSPTVSGCYPCEFKIHKRYTIRKKPYKCLKCRCFLLVKM